jgi:hypothetical protein
MSGFFNVWKFKLLLYLCFKLLKTNYMTQDEMTHEEYESKKSEMIAHFTNEIEFLKVQKEYETLVTDIEELRMRRALMQQKLASVFAPAPEEQEEEQPRTRQLKKDK